MHIATAQNSSTEKATNTWLAARTHLVQQKNCFSGFGAAGGREQCGLNFMGSLGAFN
jgi:hypothetical protein